MPGYLSAGGVIALVFKGPNLRLLARQMKKINND